MISPHIFLITEECFFNLEAFGNLSMVFIAIINTYLIWSNSRIKNAQIDTHKEQNRKLALLKSLIFDHNLNHFYNCFDSLQCHLSELKSDSLNDQNKSSIIERGNSEFITLRKKFTDTLLAVDTNLYKEVMACADELQNQISENAFDQGNNLNHTPKYIECIESPILNTRTKILKILFQYKG